MPMSEREKAMTVEEHLVAAEELFPDPPVAGDVVAFYQRDMLRSQRHLFLAQLKIARAAAQ